jgi:hypothetical protein
MQMQDHFLARTVTWEGDDEEERLFPTEEPILISSVPPETHYLHNERGKSHVIVYTTSMRQKHANHNHT